MELLLLKLTRPSSVTLLSISMVETECDLELSMFIEVCPTCLLRAPVLMRSIVSCILLDQAFDIDAVFDVLSEVEVTTVRT
jgi:hypothetical protein